MHNTNKASLLCSDKNNSVLSNHGRCRAQAYTPFGAGKSASLLAFNGVLREQHTENYLLGNGYRTYNPTLMIFHSPDNASPFGRGGINSYAYAQGDPVNRIDPTGHWSLPTWLTKKFKRSSLSGAVPKIEQKHFTDGELARYSWIDSNITSHPKFNQLPISKPTLEDYSRHALRGFPNTTIDSALPPNFISKQSRFSNIGPAHNTVVDIYKSAPDALSRNTAKEILIDAYRPESLHPDQIVPRFNISRDFNRIYYNPETIAGYSTNPYLMDVVKQIRGFTPVN